METEQNKKENFLAIKRIIALNRKRVYTDESMLAFIAGFCGYIPKEDDLKFDEELK